MGARVPALWLVIALTAGCPGGRPRSAEPRVRPVAVTKAEAAEHGLLAAEARCRKRPRIRAAWRDLQRAARRAGQPHRYLLALEATEARGRLPRDLYGALARRLRRRARNLAHLSAPAAALHALARADRLAAPPARQRAALEILRDRLALQRADGWLAADDADAARKVVRDLARRAVLDGEELAWRRAALGEIRDLGAVVAALHKLRHVAPAPVQRLARIVLASGTRDPGTLVAALEAATLGVDVQLVQELDARLAKVAPRPLLATACRLRRRPGSPCCRQLQRWAATNRDALGRWATLCRALHWSPGDPAWIQRVIRLLQITGDPGLGPLEDLVSVSRVRQTLRVSPHSLALMRLAGQTAAHRNALAGTGGLSTPTRNLMTPEQRAVEAWAAGLVPMAVTLLSQAAGVLTASRPTATGLKARCRIVRLTRLVGKRAAAFGLLTALTSKDPRFRKHVLGRLLAQGRPVAALVLAHPGEERSTVAWLRALGKTLHRWGVSADRTLLGHWTRRHGAGPANRAWRYVTAGSRDAAKEQTKGLERVLRLAGQGQLVEARSAALGLVRTGTTRVRRSGMLAPHFLIWWAWLAQASGDKQTARRRLRRLLHQDPGGFRDLPAVTKTLAWLGHKRAAGRLADRLYERALSDPALLRLVTRGAITAGRAAKAELAITDWASQTGRPDRVYLSAAAWTAQQGQHDRAAALASKALVWSGGRPLEAALATLRHQWAARRTAEAQRTTVWLQTRWPVGNGRNGISQTLAVTLLAADRLEGARRLGQLQRGQDLPALLRKRRFVEVGRAAEVRAMRQPLVARWPALAALAHQGRRKWHLAAKHIDRLARLAPRAESLALALLHADQGHIHAALAMLALAHNTRPDVRLLWLAASLAARAGKWPLAARMASRAIIGGPSKKSSSVTGAELTRMTALVKRALLPLEIPWARLLTTPAPGSCEP